LLSRDKRWSSLLQIGEEGEVEDKRRRESSSERLNKVKRRFQKVLSQNEPGNLPAVQRARPNQVNPLRGWARECRRRRF
jgi:hypothetical protein